MLNLDEISKSIEEPLAKETPESMRKWLDEYDHKQEVNQKEEEDKYSGNLRDLHWLMTGWVNMTNEYGCQDTHIFATVLVNLIKERGFEIVKITNS